MCATDKTFPDGWLGSIGGYISRLMAVCALTLGSFGAIAQQTKEVKLLNEQVNQWVLEAHKLRAVDYAPLLEQAKAGHLRAMFLLFESAQAGPEGERTSPTAVELGKLILQAVERNELLARGMHGVILVYGGFGSTPAPQFGARHLDRAAADGLAMSMFDIGLLHRDGLAGLAKNDAEAVSWFRKAAEAGFASVTVDLAGHYLRGQGVAKDEAQAVAWYRKGVEARLPGAMYGLASMYRSGSGGLSKDDEQALTLSRRAADAGHAEAASAVGWHYQMGRGVMKDETQAVAWYRKGVVGGSSAGMHNLAVAYRDGLGGLEKDDAQALSWFRKAADAGFAEAAANAGWHYQMGRGVAIDAAQALSWYRKAAEAGNGLGMSNLAVMYRDGKVGLVKDDGQSHSWFRKAAEVGYVPAMAEVGWNYQVGRGVNKDEMQAVAWYRKAAEAGNGVAMYNLAQMHYSGSGGLAKDDAQALSWFRKAADAGYAQALHDVGVHYQMGRGVVKDEAQAAIWYRRAADAGIASGMGNLAWMYQRGRGGLVKDDVLALTWLRKAADLRSPFAMSELGFLYRDGRGGLKKDCDLAVKWIKAAAEVGRPAAMAGIAHMYQTGECLTKDPEQGAVWNLKAAEAGDEHGMNNLANQYRKGSGVPKDDALSYAWFQKAAEAGHPSAMVEMGSAYARGLGGLKQSDQLAVQWLAKALVASETRDFKMTTSGLPVGQWVRREIDDLIATGVIADNGALREARSLARPAPQLTWGEVPQRTDQPTVTLRVRVRDTGGGVGRIELRANGAAVGLFERAGGRNATPIQGASNADEEWHYLLTLPKGTHQLEVWAYNGENLINFSRASRTITSSYEAPRKPRLYAVVVGVDQYEDRTLQLNFAGSDAKALARQLQRQIDVGTLYSGGKVTLLTSKEQTTKVSIAQELRRHHSKELVSGDDVFVFFVAGHGWFDTQSNRYHMFTSDVLHRGPDKLMQTTIVGDELRDLVGNVPAHKKLLLLDTCDSGGFARDGAQSLLKARSAMGEQQIIDVMRARTGAAVFAASGTKEEANEGYEGHGVFSYYLLEGLKGKALREGKAFITTDDLKIYVEDQVPEAMARKKWGKQAPVAALQGQGFPVAAKN